ncbi:uncharacterized protein V1516DRAFT_713796 [Lipomyces oligophaga]|uniref:uncharacterized protein n=1 Tax=Lipomyces oligophaga TaxID=45792 RepID=UPI0034CE4E31
MENDPFVKPSRSRINRELIYRTLTAWDFHRRDEGSQRRQQPPKYRRTTYTQTEKYLARLSPSLPTESLPTQRELYVHLKVIRLFRVVRDLVVKTDGLFGILNQTVDEDRRREHREGKDFEPGYLRFATFVSRAVSRYQLWFSRLPTDSEPFDFDDLFCHGFGLEQTELTAEQLPPVDILMIWYTHMLHPREYWQDLVRSNRRMLIYNLKFPWSIVNSVIPQTPDWSYTLSKLYEPPFSAIERFESLTGRLFNPLEDTTTLSLNCYRCEELVYIPEYRSDASGWVQIEFSIQCPSCNKSITRSELSQDKLLQDLIAFNSDGIPLKGTLVDSLGSIGRTVTENYDARTIHEILISALPEIPFDNIQTWDDKTKLVRRRIRNLDDDLFSFGSSALASSSHFKSQALFNFHKSYTNNASRFSLNLERAVLINFRFIDRMTKLAYLESPFKSVTLDRSLMRFIYFFILRSEKQGLVWCPTDAEIVWKTMMCNPGLHLAFSLLGLGALVDSSRGLDEYMSDDDSGKSQSIHKIIIANRIVLKANFHEDWALCTCAFCEAERAYEEYESEILRLVDSIRLSKSERIDRFYSDQCLIAKKLRDLSVIKLNGPGYLQHPYYLSVDCNGDSTHQAEQDQAEAKAGRRLLGHRNRMSLPSNTNLQDEQNSDQTIMLMNTILTQD